MLHPSYTDLMKVVNSEVEPGEAPVVHNPPAVILSLWQLLREQDRSSQVTSLW